MELERRTEGAGWRITWIPNQELLHQHWDKSGIYYLLCQTTKVGYIGSAKRFSQRLKSHFGDLGTHCHVNKKMQSAFDQYGPDSFTWGIVEECQIHELNAREQYWINRYTPDRLFNIDLKVARSYHNLIISRDEASRYLNDYIGVEIESLMPEDGWIEWHITNDTSKQDDFMHWFPFWSDGQNLYIAGKLFVMGVHVPAVKKLTVREEMEAKGFTFRGKY